MYEVYQRVPVNFVKEPVFRKLHGDPRWNEFLEKIGKAPEQLAAIELDPKLSGN